MSDIIDELAWRGLIAHSTDLEELRKALDSGQVTFYAASTRPRRGCTLGTWRSC